MRRARVAELKARLSEYLRAVRRGDSVTVLDRETPIARIVPYAGDAQALRVRPPRPGATPLAKLKFPPPLRVKVDIGVDLAMATHDTALAVAARAHGLRVLGS